MLPAPSLPDGPHAHTDPAWATHLPLLLLCSAPLSRVAVQSALPSHEGVCAEPIPNPTGAALSRANLASKPHRVFPVERHEEHAQASHRCFAFPLFQSSCTDSCSSGAAARHRLFLSGFPRPLQASARGSGGGGGQQLPLGPPFPHSLIGGNVCMQSKSCHDPDAASKLHNASAHRTCTRACHTVVAL